MGILRKKPHIVRRKAVFLDKRKEVLGVRYLSMMKLFLVNGNPDLLMIRGAFWKRVIIHKYGKEDGGWCSKEGE